MNYRTPFPIRRSTKTFTTTCVTAFALIVSSSALHGDDPTVTLTASAPLHGNQEVRLEEQWRVESDDGELLLGLISDVLVDSAGTFYLLDSQLCQVHVLDPHGIYLHSLSREGEGPGEVRRPVGLLFLPEARIGILQRMPGKIVLVDSEGNPAGSIEPTDEDQGTRIPMMLREATYRAGRLVMVGSTIRRRGGGFRPKEFLSIFDLDGVEKLRFLEKERQIDFQNPRYVEEREDFVDRGRWAVDPIGTVYAAPDRSRYRIEAYAPDGTLVRIIEREGYEPRQRTAEEKEALAGRLRMMRRGRRMQVEAVMADRESAVVRLHALESGDLWVLHSSSLHPEEDGVFCTFDVYNTDGEYVAEKAIMCDGDPLVDRLFVIDEDRFILVRGFEDVAAQTRSDETTAEEPEPLSVSFLTASR
jgi:hypothetical protein